MTIPEVAPSDERSLSRRKMAKPQSFDFENCLTYHCNLEGQGPHSWRQSRAFALVAEDFDHQIGKTIHDFRLLFEVGCCVYHALDSHNPFHSIEAAERLANVS